MIVSCKNMYFCTNLVLCKIFEMIDSLLMVFQLISLILCNEPTCINHHFKYLCNGHKVRGSCLKSWLNIGSFKVSPSWGATLRSFPTCFKRSRSNSATTTTTSTWTQLAQRREDIFGKTRRTSCFSGSRQRACSGASFRRSTSLIWA